MTATEPKRSTAFGSDYFRGAARTSASQFAETYRALASAIPADSIIDGELAALDAEGRPSFQLIQNSASRAAPVVFFAFDILMLAGRDVRSLPLSQRRQLLRDSLRTSDLVQLSESFSVPAARMIALAQEHGLEGVVAKRLTMGKETRIERPTSTLGADCLAMHWFDFAAVPGS